MEKIPNIPDKKLVKGSNWHLGDVEGDQGDLCDSIIASVMLYETEVYGKVSGKFYYLTPNVVFHFTEMLIYIGH